jgi:hypothetical protein
VQDTRGPGTTRTTHIATIAIKVVLCKKRTSINLKNF